MRNLWEIEVISPFGCQNQLSNPGKQQRQENEGDNKSIRIWRLKPFNHYAFCFIFLSDKQKDSFLLFFRWWNSIFRFLIILHYLVEARHWNPFCMEEFQDIPFISSLTVQVYPYMGKDHGRVEKSEEHSTQTEKRLLGSNSFFGSSHVLSMNIESMYEEDWLE